MDLMIRAGDGADLGDVHGLDESFIVDFVLSLSICTFRMNMYVMRPG